MRMVWEVGLLVRVNDGNNCVEKLEKWRKRGECKRKTGYPSSLNFDIDLSMKASQFYSPATSTNAVTNHNSNGNPTKALPNTNNNNNERMNDSIWIKSHSPPYNTINRKLVFNGSHLMEIWGYTFFIADVVVVVIIHIFYWCCCCCCCWSPSFLIVVFFFGVVCVCRFALIGRQNAVCRVQIVCLAYIIEYSYLGNMCIFYRKIQRYIRIMREK